MWQSVACRLLRLDGWTYNEGYLIPCCGFEHVERYCEGDQYSVVVSENQAWIRFRPTAGRVPRPGDSLISA